MFVSDLKLPSGPPDSPNPTAPATPIWSFSPDWIWKSPRGERLALVGESGAGKSTLLHLLGGLDRPTEGAIYFGHNDICKLPQSELADFRNRELGFVWQIHSLLAEFTALENVMMPLLIRGQSRDQAEPVSLARLDEVGLKNRATHRAGELSGGEQQRVVLARALVGDPKVLLADEPTGSLDFRTGEMIMESDRGPASLAESYLDSCHPQFEFRAPCGPGARAGARPPVSRGLLSIRASDIGQELCLNVIPKRPAG